MFVHSRCIYAYIVAYICIYTLLEKSWFYFVYFYDLPIAVTALLTKSSYVIKCKCVRGVLVARRLDYFQASSQTISGHGSYNNFISLFVLQNFNSYNLPIRLRYGSVLFHFLFLSFSFFFHFILFFFFSVCFYLSIFHKNAYKLRISHIRI